MTVDVTAVKTLRGARLKHGRP
ncbi:hypothetical protein EMIT048CA2_50345 [Pseudomonas chlororaphis]